MAAEVLTGEKTTSEIPVEYPADMQLFINKEAAEAQGSSGMMNGMSIAEFYEAE